MGFNITQFLVVPKVFALALCGPLLTVWSIAAGLAGGIVVSWFSLDITPAAFIDETYLALGTLDLVTGLIKSEVFAILVAIAGCFRGLQAIQGADSVGRQTTSAVVSGIFLIIMADAVFTVLFHNLGW
jgi:phospholipid/cholesterol/gamma-HCH transport system permease protein